MFAKMLWVAHIWLTAFSTLFASISPCQCICPNGHCKLFCLGIACQPSACCCSGACCGRAGRDGCCRTPGRADGKLAKRRCCCCQAKSARGSDTDAGHRQVEGRGCKRTLSRAKLLTGPARLQEANDCAAAVPLAPQPPLPLPALLTPNRLFSWESYRPPPPTDRTIAFRHFVI